MNLLITGGAGFVGSNLAIAFKKQYPDHRITALDNLHRRGSELNLQRLKEHHIEFVHGDIRNREDFDVIKEVDLMLECSAEPSVMAGYTSSPDYLINTNLLGTVNCLELARRTGADIIFLSTSRVYPIQTINSLNYVERETRFDLADSQPVPGASARGFTEAFPLDGPRSLYGATKLCSELLLQEYIAMYGLRGIINRCGLLTGPWQMGKVDQGVVVFWAARHHFRQPLQYIGYDGTGKQVRDMLHIHDLFRLLDLQARKIESLSGEIFNVGGGPEVSLSLCELTALCEKHTGGSVPITRVAEDRPGDIRSYLTDNTKVTRMTGWTPAIGSGEILAEIAAWIRQSEGMLRPILA